MSDTVDHYCLVLIRALGSAGKAGATRWDLTQHAVVKGVRGIPQEEVRQALESLMQSGIVGKCPCMLGEQPQWRWFLKDKMPKKFVPPANLARL